MAREFPGTARVHVALTVKDIEASVAFYTALFGTRPSKVKPGYAKLEPQDPSLNLALNEGEPLPSAAQSHFGVEMKSARAVTEAALRLRAAGLEAPEPHSATCCYALQDKVWLTDPDGHRWEVFAVERDSEAFADNPVATKCCPKESTAHG